MGLRDAPRSTGSPRAPTYTYSSTGTTRSSSPTETWRVRSAPPPSRCLELDRAARGSRGASITLAAIFCRLCGQEPSVRFTAFMELFLECYRVGCAAGFEHVPAKALWL